MESENLNVPIENFVRKDWKEIKLYKIAAHQQDALLNNSSVERKYFIFQPNEHWPQHSHDRSQCLLVIDGEITHVSKGREYTQRKYEVLIVPAYLSHTAFAGKAGVKLWVITKKFPPKIE
jgi:quercetin dioxygenase-like cupin family protein